MIILKERGGGGVPACWFILACYSGWGWTKPSQVPGTYCWRPARGAGSPSWAIVSASQAPREQAVAVGSSSEGTDPEPRWVGLPLDQRCPLCPRSVQASCCAGCPLVCWMFPMMRFCWSLWAGGHVSLDSCALPLHAGAVAMPGLVVTWHRAASGSFLGS